MLGCGIQVSAGALGARGSGSVKNKAAEPGEQEDNSGKGKKKQGKQKTWLPL